MSWLFYSRGRRNKAGGHYYGLRLPWAVNATLISEKEQLCAWSWRTGDMMGVCVWMRLSRLIRVLFEVGGLGGGSKHRIASTDGRPQIFARLGV